MAATRQQHRPRRLASLLLLSFCALLLVLQPASALFGFGKKKEGDVKAQEAAARAGLEEAVKAEATKRGSSKGAEPAKKPKPRAGVTARKVGVDGVVVVEVCIYLWI